MPEVPASELESHIREGLATLRDGTYAVLDSTITGARCYVIGTAHVSAESAEQVGKLIKLVEPDAVVLELCSARYQMISKAYMDANNKEMTTQQMVENIRKGNTLQVAISYLYSTVSKQLKIQPGAEFQAAALASCKFHPPAPLVLGDRQLNVTLSRVWDSLNLWHKIRLSWLLLCDSFSNDISEEYVEQMKDKDMITAMMGELVEQLPTIAEPLLYERDRYLTQSIRTLSLCTHTADSGMWKTHFEGEQAVRFTELYSLDAKGMPARLHPQALQHHANSQYVNKARNTHSRKPGQEVIVAVVGLGHLAGICEMFDASQVTWKDSSGKEHTQPFDSSYIAHITTVNTDSSPGLLGFLKGLTQTYIGFRAIQGAHWGLQRLTGLTGKPVALMLAAVPLLLKTRRNIVHRRTRRKKKEAKSAVIEIPAGCKPGDRLATKGGYTVVVPEGAKPGDKISVALPAQSES